MDAEMQGGSKVEELEYYDEKVLPSIMAVGNETNKIRWERWRARQDKGREKSYCYWGLDIDWGCVSDCVIGGCMGAVIEYITHGTVPSDAPPICAVCILLLVSCYQVPNYISCGGAAVCMGIQLCYCIAIC